MNTTELFSTLPYKVADLSLAEFGRKEIELAEKEKAERERQKAQQESQRRSTQSNTSSSNPYEVLGVPRNAPKDQVKDAWRLLSKKYHPDTVKDKEPRVQELFGREFDKINKAYEEIKRARGWN